MPTISVVLPNLQEETIFELIDQIRTILKDYKLEIIVVNHSSEEYLKRLKQKEVIIIKQEPLGVESALMQGFAISTGEILASTDCDLTHQTDGLLNAIKLIEDNIADLVLGNRIGNLTNGSMQNHLEFGNKALADIYNKRFNTNIHDITTGLFAMRRSVYETIKNTKLYHAGTCFFAIEAAHKHFDIKEIQIKYYPRKYGESKLAKSKFLWGLAVGFKIIF